jgi:hypothetical protein
MKAFVSQLLQICHSQWIFRNYTLYDKQRGFLCLWEHLEVLQEVHRLLDMALANISEESQYLLDLDYSTLYNSSYERQAYWVLAMKVARHAGWRATAWERVQGGLQCQRSSRAGTRSIRYDFRTLTKQMRFELCLVILTRHRPHSTLVLAESASNKRLRKPNLWDAL